MGFFDWFDDEVIVETNVMTTHDLTQYTFIFGILLLLLVYFFLKWRQTCVREQEQLREQLAQLQRTVGLSNIKSV